MIIKKWTGSAWQAESVKVTFSDIVADVTAGTPVSIFESGKLKLNYLPDAVFDSLNFAGTGSSSIALTLSTYAGKAFREGRTVGVNRSPLGYYWVSSAGNTFTGNTTPVIYPSATQLAGYTYNNLSSSTSFGSQAPYYTNANPNGVITAANGTIIQDIVGNNIYVNTNGGTGWTGVAAGTAVPFTTFGNGNTIYDTRTERLYVYNGSNGTLGQLTLSTVASVGGIHINTVFNPGDSVSNSPQTGVSTSTLEAGDWFVISGMTGLGTSASPYVVSFSVVNNVYENMVGANGTVAGAPGIVPGPAATDNVKFLRGDATWATPTDTNTTYTISTIGDGSNPYAEVIRLTAGGSGSGNDDVKIAVGATSLLTKTATTNSTTTVTIADTSGLVVGQLVEGSGIQVNTLITAITTNVSITISLAAQTSLVGTTLTFSTFGLTIEQASDVITVKHADTSSAANLASAARTYVTGLTFDTFGHVIGYSTGSESVVDTNTATAVDNILDGSNSGTAITYAPYATAEAGKLSATSTLAAGTNTLAYSGYFYANQIYEGATRVLTSQNTSKNIVGAANNATANAVATNGNVFINHLEASTVTSFHNIIGSGATTVVSDASGNITISSTDNNTIYSAGSGISLSTTTFSVGAGVGLTQEATGLKMAKPIEIGTTTPAAAFQISNGALWFDLT